MEVWESAARELCCMPTLLWLALQDKKYYGIKPVGVVVASLFILCGGYFGNATWQSRVGGVAVGVDIILFAYFSKEAVGIADGIVISVCGAAFGLYETVTLCFLAAVYAAGFSVVLLILKKAGRKSRIPFLPFLLLGYVTMRLFINSL